MKVRCNKAVSCECKREDCPHHPAHKPTIYPNGDDCTDPDECGMDGFHMVRCVEVAEKEKAA